MFDKPPALDRPPFNPVVDQDAAAAAQEIVSVFAYYDKMDSPLQAVLDQTMAAIGVGSDDPLLLAARDVAAEMALGVGAGMHNAYHNARHFREVMLCSLFIARLTGLSQREQVQIVVAALLHDFHHDGRGNGDHPFRLELMACARAESYLQRAGVSAEEQSRLRTLILATEITMGVPLARSCHLAHQARKVGGAAVPGQAPTVSPGKLPRPEMSALIADCRLALQAVILSEGDLLPSFGLTVEWADRSEALLASEMTLPLGPRSKIDFIDGTIGDFVVAKFFSPNLQRIRHVNAQRLQLV